MSEALDWFTIEVDGVEYPAEVAEVGVSRFVVLAKEPTADGRTRYFFGYAGASVDRSSYFDSTEDMPDVPIGHPVFIRYET